MPAANACVAEGQLGNSWAARPKGCLAKGHQQGLKAPAEQRGTSTAEGHQPSRRAPAGLEITSRAEGHQQSRRATTGPEGHQQS